MYKGDSKVKIMDAIHSSRLINLKISIATLWKN